MQYLEIKGTGASVYTDAFLIGVGNIPRHWIVFISLFGRPTAVKMVSALLLEQKQVWLEDGSELLRPHYSLRSLTEHVEGGVCHKVLFCPEYYTGQNRHAGRVVLGEDKTAAFDYVASITTTPLKREWADFLWENVVEKERLRGFGTLDGRELDEAYIVTLPEDINLDEVVLDGLRAGEID